ncbi:MAG: IclR family transcriptional regulator C-terminal domain-containing protein, partial [Bifidobacterium longum]|nr:IclR family transcriptional regulator C-terminal domain-containing protein [Bifidobacterium longum]
RFSPHAEVDQNLPLTWKTSTRSHGPLSIEQTHALPRNQIRALYPNRQAFTDRTGIGPKSPKELEATLAETRRTGFAEEHGDVTPGFDSYAVAVRDYNDFPIAGLALTFVSGSLRSEQERSLKTKLRLAGAELSRRLGAVGSLT